MAFPHYADTLPKGHVRDWLRAEYDGYTWNKEAGLLLRQDFPDGILENLGQTVLDIIFPRPSDLHHHEDVDEAVLVLDGSGEFQVETASKKIIVTLEKGKSVYIPKGSCHAFRPDKGKHLEIMLITKGGILDERCEVQHTRFDQYQPWIDYFSPDQSKS
ncbi:cupin domain-containing protein [Candidatus Woesearchaeota archaeon]|nr:cupin domain-containing protein [Candidatus Woesearchaeota archaeon]